MNYEHPERSSDDVTASPTPPRETSGNGTPSIRAPEDNRLRPAPAAAAPNDDSKAVNVERDKEAKSLTKEVPRKDVTVLVRGESLADASTKSATQDPQNKDKPKAPVKTISEPKLKQQSRLPGLADDADVGVQKDQVVVRDGKPDLAFNGTLLASVAPAAALKGRWQEYRVYETSAGKHVFSRLTRSIYVEDQDQYQAEVFDPSPSSVPSQLLRTARDLTRSHPLTWTDAAAHFFGYDPLAKELYRKLSGKFEEHIS